MVTISTIIGKCHHEVNLAESNSLNHTFLNINFRNRFRHNSLGVETSNATTIPCGSILVLLYFHQNMSCSYTEFSYGDKYSHRGISP